MRMKAAAAAACVLATAAGAATAAWAAVNPPLSSEVLTGTVPALTAANCNETGTSTFTYTVSGVATGPYPGTFTETVTATIGPQTEPSDHPLPVNFGPVTHLSATFTILSAAGTVTGTKELLTAPFPGNQHGICDDANVPAPTGCSATFFQADTPVTFRATITSPMGTSQEGGSGFISSGGIRTQCGGVTTASSGAFIEEFLVSQPLLPTTKDECKDDGFEDFGFKNPGQCVAFVVTGGKKPTGAGG
jgi:hypothetical protein